MNRRELMKLAAGTAFLGGLPIVSAAAAEGDPTVDAVSAVPNPDVPEEEREMVVHSDSEANMIYVLRSALDQNAPDFTVASGNPSYCSVDGELRFLGEHRITPEEAEEMMQSIASDENKQTLHKTGKVQFGFAFEDEAKIKVSALYNGEDGGPIMRFSVIEHRRKR